MAIAVAQLLEGREAAFYVHHRSVSALHSKVTEIYRAQLKLHPVNLGILRASTSISKLQTKTFKLHAQSF
jgi:predicted AAA+ superfamily ATPase